MSFGTTFSYLKKIAGDHGVEAAKPEARKDDGLPLKARIGSLVTMQQTPLIRAEANGSLLKAPEEEMRTIDSISHARLGSNGHLYRFYFTKDGDKGLGDFLQIAQDSEGAIVEAIYCSGITRYIPATEDDQIAFMGQEGYGLGALNYSLSRDQLADFGYSDAQLSAILGESDNLTYQRDVGATDQDFVAPYVGTETRINDPYGVSGVQQQIYYMPYLRKIGSSAEYLIITTAEVASEDGDSNKRSMHVDFVVGIAVERERILVQ